MMGSYLCGSMYYIIMVHFSKIKISQNQILSSAFPFTEKDKGQILEAKDTGSSRTWNRLLQISRFS